MKSTAVIVARFQTPYLHDGHRHLIAQIKEDHNRVVVVLGISPVKGSKKNPFDFYTRERLLKKEFPQLVVLPLADQPSDKNWSQQLDDLLHNTFPNEKFILYGSRNSFIPHYGGTLAVKELPAWGDHSATAIRNQHADKVMDSEDFRLGINYAYHNSYSKIYSTVDVALFKEQKQFILLGQKNGRDGWRLPGGFVDVSDASYEAAAQRELREECGAIEAGDMQYVGSVKIDDWRYRNEEDKIITMLFAADLLYGEPQAADDLCAVAWFAVSALEGMLLEKKITQEHCPLIKLLIQKTIQITQP